MYLTRVSASGSVQSFLLITLLDPGSVTILEVDLL